MPENLRCEYLINPLGIDETSPRLSWNINARSRGWIQTAYRILVASSPELIAAEKGDLWDSGKVPSSSSLHVEYQGKPLASRQECWWRVQVWDASDSPSVWSKPAYFEIGLLDENDWRESVWIGREAPPTLNGEPAPFLRRDFSLKGRIKRARIYACGIGYAELHLNGKKVGGSIERDPAYTDFGKRVLYVTHDVTELLKQGANTVGAILGTGWYDEHDEATWNFDKAPWRGRPRMRLVLSIDYFDGRTDNIISDESWKVATGPIRRDGIYTGEIYDARMEMPGWDKPGFDATQWETVSIMPAPAGKLVARPCPPIAITKTIAPVSIAEPKAGVYIVNLGQNISGHMRLRVKAPAGTAITMRYGEKLHPDGTLDTSNIDVFMTKTTPPQPFQQDTYICKGEGEEIWEQRFSYSGFQYAEVTGFPHKPAVNNFEGRFAHTNLESAGEFECSNPIFNKIQHATRWAYFSNAQSIPTDCPQREKNGWTGDAHLAAELGLMNFHSATFYTKWLNDFADNMLEDGQVGIIVPTGGWGRGDCHPAWDSAYPIIAWDLYRYCGDTRILARHYEKIRKYVDYLAGRTVDGVVPFDSLGDWVPWSTVTPSQLTSTAYLFVDARIVSRAAEILNKTEDAKKYAALAADTRNAFNAKYFDPDKNSYANGSQTALSTALFFDLAPDDRRPAVLANLVANLESLGHIDTGILGAKHVLRILSQEGRSDTAYRIAARTEQPGWGWWIIQGATTLWEDWKGESSLNHIMFGDISNWFFQWIAGIGLDPESPAFAHILIQPQPVGDLTWAKATYDSIRGRIVSDWVKGESEFHLKVSIPANSIATVWIPASGSSNVTEGGKPLDRAENVQFLRKEGERILVEIGSGDYSFKVEN
jgi:alpha-L-rhamnosidase